MLSSEVVIPQQGELTHAADVVVLHPFHIPVYVPECLRDWTLHALAHLRIISPRHDDDERHRKAARLAGMQLVRFKFPMNLVTAPLAADLFLLAILAIGRTEVKAGTIGTDNISPIDIMAFFITLAYIAVSLDATGLIRYLAYKVLNWAGKHGRRLYFYLYLFFFGLTAFIGNDPIILSGTPFLAYMCRISKNIQSPRAWIFTQFTMANVASAILVSSNPTNLVLAGAFQVRFIDYSANIIVPVIITAILLFPFLLFVVFRNEALIPSSIDVHDIPEGALTRKPVNPNIPQASTATDDDDDEASKVLPLQEIMNPYLDKWSAVYVAVVMAVTLITVLALNAATAGSGGHAYPVYWCTLPGAFITFCWDVASGWAKRHESREIAQQGRHSERSTETSTAVSGTDEEKTAPETGSGHGEVNGVTDSGLHSPTAASTPLGVEVPLQQQREAASPQRQEKVVPTTVTSLATDVWQWARETFPNASHVLALLPWPLVPFAFAMFVLVQALVTKGWVPAFAYGWDAWVSRTGTVGAVGGMGFLAVVACNVSNATDNLVHRRSMLSPRRLVTSQTHGTFLMGLRNSLQVQTLARPSCCRG